MSPAAAAAAPEARRCCRLRLIWRDGSVTFTHVVHSEPELASLRAACGRIASVIAVAEERYTLDVRPEGRGP